MFMILYFDKSTTTVIPTVRMANPIKTYLITLQHLYLPISIGDSSITSDYLSEPSDLDVSIYYPSSLKQVIYRWLCSVLANLRIP
jgi:hypothetical protein